MNECKTCKFFEPIYDNGEYMFKGECKKLAEILRMSDSRLGWFDRIKVHDSFCCSIYNEKTGD